MHAQRHSLYVGGIVPCADAVSRGNAPFHEVFRVPFDISILTLQLTIGRLAILHLHTSNSEPWNPNVSSSHLAKASYRDNDNSFLFLQNRSPILTAISPLFSNHCPSTLDLIRSISIASTISPMRDGIAIVYQKRRKTSTSAFCTAL